MTNTQTQAARAATPWTAAGPSRFVDRRVRLTREHGLVYQNVGAYRGVIVRRGEDGRPERDSCPHAHNKAAAARRCAEQAARRKNRRAEA